MSLILPSRKGWKGVEKSEDGRNRWMKRERERGKRKNRERERGKRDR